MSRSADDAAMQVDTYLDELLATRARSIAAVDVASAELAHAAAVVRDALVRFHPSFRFEEELAARLRAVASGTARAATIVRFPASSPPAPARAGAGPTDLAATSTEPDAERHDGPAPAERGWVIVGGAIASGVSLAAGVLLARRRSRADHHWERLA